MAAPPVHGPPGLCSQSLPEPHTLRIPAHSCGPSGQSPCLLPVSYHAPLQVDVRGSFPSLCVSWPWAMDPVNDLWKRGGGGRCIDTETHCDYCLG